MKDFIYFDESYLTSYLAQINKGKIVVSQENNICSNTQTKAETTPSKEVSFNIDGSGGVNIPNIAKGELNAGINAKWGSGLNCTKFSETEAEQNLLLKQLHDDSYDVFINYISENNLFTHNFELGKFISFNMPLQILDFDYLRKIFASKPLEKLLNSDKKTKNSAQKQMSSFENSLIKRYFDTLVDIMPYESYILNDNFIAPLKPKFLREASKELIFKYDSNIIFLGKVTKKISKEIDEKSNALKQFQGNIDSILLEVYSSFYTNSKCLFIISPIAAYFE